jgi:hypothetical protein
MFVLILRARSISGSMGTGSGKEVSITGMKAIGTSVSRTANGGQAIGKNTKEDGDGTRAGGNEKAPRKLAGSGCQLSS